ncbi:MAG: hypothetical protein J6J97_02175, partial [Akkermansia sp.]|nr:hypothetical protein [Akkermansia sp.]
PAHFVRGSDMFFVLPSVPPRGGSTLGYYYVALTGSEFLGLSARQIPIYRTERGSIFPSGADPPTVGKSFPGMCSHAALAA